MILPIDEASSSTLNSNLILLIPLVGRVDRWFIHFKFQSDSINTFVEREHVTDDSIFKFQSDSINTDRAYELGADFVHFKFQSDSINTYLIYVMEPCHVL